MPTATYRALYGLAEGQMGHLTTAQAAAVGVQPMALVMMTRRGTLARISRGVYRLVDFPTHPLAHYMQATLWPYGQIGVLSHETALTLYAMSSISQSEVHISVPTDFRIQRRIPNHLVVHFSDLPTADVTILERMRITTPERTVRDCISVRAARPLIAPAIKEGLRIGCLTETAAAALRKELRIVESAIGGKQRLSRTTRRADTAV
jgi:predicted transcriptional regulator of viral defense system